MTLGSGTGQGYELITKIDKRDLDLSLQHDRVLPDDGIEVYLGLDLCQEMVDKGNEIFKDNVNIKFKQADLREGLDAVKKERPFDIYFFILCFHVSPRQTSLSTTPERHMQSQQ